MSVPQPFLRENIVGVQVCFVRIPSVLLERPLYQLSLFSVREQVREVDEARTSLEYVGGFGESVIELNVDVFIRKSSWVALPAPA